jgi:hypothetical protein
MIILGINGGPDFIDDNWVEGPIGNHDSSAALLRDGRLVAAVEEERLNRFKHTNKAPLASIAFCLEQAGVSLSDIDVIAIPQSESDLSGTLLKQYQTDPAWRERFGFVSGRRYVVERLESRFGTAVHPNKIYFTHHHVGHAASAYHLSGFDSALVAALDGYGGGPSGLLAAGRGSRLETLKHSLRYGGLQRSCALYRTAFVRSLGGYADGSEPYSDRELLFRALRRQARVSPNMSVTSGWRVSRSPDRMTWQLRGDDEQRRLALAESYRASLEAAGLLDDNGMRFALIAHVAGQVYTYAARREQREAAGAALALIARLSRGPVRASGPRSEAAAG